ncbi:S9 family peptidase [Lacticaseibacillus sp. N501-2]|uniref:S9 family peptidase n=1 Tax=Lacticaseibacillus salsurae TaxID=3367729 RepID=UPI0038B279EF
MRITTTDLFALHTFSKPLLVSGGVIAVDNWLDAKTNTYQRTLAYYPDGQAAVSLGFDQQHDTDPQWSHDQLAFLSQATDGTTQIFTQSLLGEPAIQRSWVKSGVEHFLWDDAGLGWYIQTHESLAQASQFPHATRLTRLHIQDNGHGLRPENTQTTLFYQGLAAAKQRVVYQSRTAFQLVAATKDALALAFEPDDHFNGDHSPATTTALFDLASNQATPIVTGSARALAFSPDGQKLLFVGDPGDGTALADTLMIYDRNLGSYQEIFTDAPEVGNWTVADSQQNLANIAARFVDNDQVMFLYSDAGQVFLATSDLQGHWQQLDTPAGSISDFNNAGQDVVYTYTNFTTPSQLWHGQQLVADLNANWSKAHQVQTPQAFSFTRAGFEIHGWYLPPVASSQKHPAILSVHGGPHAAYGDIFFHELQVFAAQGFGVIFTNPRGSATYGREFLAGNLADYGGEDYQDLMAALDVGLKLDPTIDTDHLYMTGGSYGGFMANWMVTHTDRFAAIVSQRAISDWLSFFGTSDIGYFFGNLELGQYQLDGSHRDAWWQQSPLAHVQNAHTPLLLMHSEDDLRVPIGQSEEFYAALKMQGSPVEFLRFPDSNHDLSRTGLPNLRLERLDAVLDWFNRHQ